MELRLRTIILAGLAALSGLRCSAGSSTVRLRQPGQPERVVRVPRLPPVQLSREEYTAAMRLLAPYVQRLRVERPSPSQVRLATGDPAELQIAAGYLQWCSRNHGTPTDCLGIVGPSGTLDSQARMDFALDVALSGAVREAALALGSITPDQVRAMLSMTIGATIVGLVSPDPLTKALGFIVSANLVAYLGVELFNHVVKGYLLMSEEALLARDFGELHQAGERYASRLGISLARIMTTVATYGIAKFSGLGPTTTAQLPGGARAAALAESQGFSIHWIDGLKSMSLSTDGTLTMSFAAGVAMVAVRPSLGGSPSGFDPNEAPSSEKLAASLLKDGFKKPAGSATHHIVAGKAGAAEPARAILRRFKIGINDAPNGVHLPCDSRTPCAAPGEVHASLHTETYYRAVNSYLAEASTREQVIQILARIRQMLLDGTFPR